MDKNKGGRPKKDRTGQRIWIPAELVDFVLAMVNVAKQRQQAQQ
jgi:hypothetical protein